MMNEWLLLVPPSVVANADAKAPVMVLVEDKIRFPASGNTAHAGTGQHGYASQENLKHA